MTVRVPAGWLPVLGTLCLMLLPGNARAIPPGVRLTQVVVDAWTTIDGLPQDRVQSIAQTADGLLWVGTESGLARFDGHRFAVYAPASHPALRNESITALLGTPDGILWIGTGSGLVVRVDRGSPATVPWDGEPDAVWDFTQDAQGRVHAATGSGLFRHEGGRLRPLATGIGPLFAVAVAGDGTAFVGGRRGLFRLKDGALHHFSERDGYDFGRVSSLDFSADGSLWLGLRSLGVVRYQNGRWLTQNLGGGAIGDLVRTVVVDRHDRAWVGSWNGLARLEETGFSPWVTQAGQMPTAIDVVFEDRDGSIWVGTMGGGLYRIRDGAATTYTALDGLRRDDLLAICADAKGRIWVGASDVGVDVFSGGVWRRLTARAPAGEPTAWACAVDRDDTTWIGTSSGLLRATYPDARVFPLPGVAPDSLIYSVFASRTHGVWAVADGGAFRIADGVAVKVPVDVEGGIDAVIGESPDGTIWMSSERGLYAWRGGRVELAWRARSAAQTPVSLLALPDGALLVGTAAAGLLHYRAGHAVLLGRASGLPDLTIATVLDDGLGFVWFATHAGIARVPLARLATVTASTRLDPIVYTVRDGLRSHYSDERGQPAGVRDSRGHLWFATTRGAVEFNPADLPVKPGPTGVFIDDVAVDGRPLAPSGAAPPGRGMLRVRYTAAQRVSSPHVRFRYRLVGFDPDWIEVGSVREALYTNVPPGRYRFVVGAADETSDWSADEAAIVIVLEPYWYQTWWFLGLGITALVGASVAVPVLRAGRARRDAEALGRIVDNRTAELRAEIHDRRMAEVALRDSEGRYRALASELDDRVQDRTRALEAEIAERKQTEADLVRARDEAEAATRAKSAFLASMSHELRTPLNAILGYSDMLREDAAAGGQTDLEKDLGRIHGAGSHLLALVSDLLDFARIEAQQIKITPDTFVVLPVAHAAVDAVSALAERGRNTVRLCAANDPGEMHSDPVRLKQVLINLLGNACKFTQNGTVTLDVRAEVRDDVRWLTFAVSDTGIGIADEDLPKLFNRFSQVDGSFQRRHDGAGLGLAISKRLCVLMGGTIDLASEVGKGTTVTVRLPASIGDDGVATSGPASPDVHAGRP